MKFIKKSMSFLIFISLLLNSFQTFPMIKLLSSLYKTNEESSDINIEEYGSSNSSNTTTNSSNERISDESNISLEKIIIDEREQSNNKILITDIPSEVLAHIFSFLDSHFYQIENLLFTCNDFRKAVKYALKDKKNWNHKIKIFSKNIKNISRDNATNIKEKLRNIIDNFDDLDNDLKSKWNKTKEHEEFIQYVKSKRSLRQALKMKEQLPEKIEHVANKLQNKKIILEVLSKKGTVAKYKLDSNLSDKLYPNCEKIKKLLKTSRSKVRTEQNHLKLALWLSNAKKKTKKCCNNCIKKCNSCTGCLLSCIGCCGSTIIGCTGCCATGSISCLTGCCGLCSSGGLSTCAIGCIAGFSGLGITQFICFITAIGLFVIYIVTLLAPAVECDNIPWNVICKKKKALISNDIINSTISTNATTNLMNLHQ